MSHVHVRYELGAVSQARRLTFTCFMPRSLIKQNLMKTMRMFFIPPLRLTDNCEKCDFVQLAQQSKAACCSALKTSCAITLPVTCAQSSAHTGGNAWGARYSAFTQYLGDLRTSDSRLTSFLGKQLSNDSLKLTTIMSVHVATRSQPASTNTRCETSIHFIHSTATPLDVDHSLRRLGLDWAHFSHDHPAHGICRSDLAHDGCVPHTPTTNLQGQSARRRKQQSPYAKASPFKYLEYGS